MRARTAALPAVIIALLICPAPLLAQPPQSSPSSTPMAVPRVINISGTFRPADGQQPSRVEVVTLAVYADETGGEPLWQETQSVGIDPSGSYALLLGATAADGVPLEVFASGQARWLSMTWSRAGEVEGPRTRLTSVPYALRASDAATLGGKPASAYQLAPTAGGGRTTSAGSQDVSTPQTVLPGTTNVLAKYVNGADVGNSAVYESGGFVGINTTSPLDVLHARFTNGGGNLTGIAVQNLANTATSYSGMLFYDHTGALGQFQGFNNSTKEYRINNIAAGGTINFMTGAPRVSRWPTTAKSELGSPTRSGNWMSPRQPQAPLPLKPGIPTAEMSMASRLLGSRSMASGMVLAGTLRAASMVSTHERIQALTPAPHTESTPTYTARRGHALRSMPTVG